MKRIVATVALLGSLLALGEGASYAQSAEIAKIKVDRRGDIHLNGKTASLTDLKQALARVKSVGGVVWYHRENPQGEPTDAQRTTVDAVMRAIVAEKVPVRLVEKDFD